MRSLIRRRAMADVPHDPAPTKWGYRYQRLMLTPGVRAAMRIGLPVLLVSMVAGAWFAKPESRAMRTSQIQTSSGLSGGERRRSAPTRALISGRR